MRYSTSHRKETFERIVKAASRLFNERGYNGIGVDGIMKAVGLTAGGFYAHFRSKDALLAKALEAGSDRFYGVLLAGLDPTQPEEWLRAVIHRYLSRQHRDEIAEGCALTTLTADIARGPSSAQKLFEVYFNKLVDEIAAKLSAKNRKVKLSFEEAQDQAYALIAMSVGGIMLSRAVRSKELSDRIVLACRRAAVRAAGLSEKPSVDQSDGKTVLDFVTRQERGREREGGR